jgi:signal transduction histidine kinase
MPHSHVPELQDAAEAMTLTARRLDDLVRRERAFSADASHQLRTPLAGLRANIETELAFPRPRPTDVLNEALGDIDRLEHTIAELLAIARARTDVPAAFGLAEVLSAADMAWRGRFAARGRPLVVGLAPPEVSIVGSAALLRQSLDVLLDNALVHGAGRTRIEHHATTDTVTIAVSDEGPGFPEAPLPQHADTTHGMGLPLARRLVEAMPGRLTIAAADRGARIEITLSRSELSPPRAATSL